MSKALGSHCISIVRVKVKAGAGGSGTNCKLYSFHFCLTLSYAPLSWPCLTVVNQTTGISAVVHLVKIITFRETTTTKVLLLLVLIIIVLMPCRCLSAMVLLTHLTTSNSVFEQRMSNCLIRATSECRRLLADWLVCFSLM